MTHESILSDFAQQKFFTQACYSISNTIEKKTKLICFPANSSTHIYDVASLTKIFVTGSMLADSIVNCGLELKTPLSQFPKWQNRYSLGANLLQQITIGDLVSHTSGLAPWFPFYAIKKSDEPLLWNLIFSKVQQDGKRRYSDLGFILLGSLLEELHGITIHDWFERHVLKVLNLKKTGFRSQLQHLVQNQFVPTSVGNPFEKILAKRILSEWEKDLRFAKIDYLPANEIPFREYRLQGECNDGNCFHFNQVAPHAGLFSSAEELLIMAQYLFDKESSSRKVFQQLVAANSGAKEFLFCASDETLSWNSTLSLVGHHGFTGCSFSMDQTFSQFRIFLSNRQYFGLDKQNNYPQWKKILTLLSELD